jgi:hypothetical protein
MNRGSYMTRCKPLRVPRTPLLEPITKRGTPGGSDAPGRGGASLYLLTNRQRLGESRRRKRTSSTRRPERLLLAPFVFNRRPLSCLSARSEAKSSRSAKGRFRPIRPRLNAEPHRWPKRSLANCVLGFGPRRLGSPSGQPPASSGRAGANWVYPQALGADAVTN